LISCPSFESDDNAEDTITMDLFNKVTIF
jgi:hypothetical protein